MTIYNNGWLNLKGVTDKNREAVKKAFYDVFGGEEKNDTGDVACGVFIHTHGQSI